LKRLHNLALGLGWLALPVLARGRWRLAGRAGSPFRRAARVSSVQRLGAPAEQMPEHLVPPMELAVMPICNLQSSILNLKSSEAWRLPTRFSARLAQRGEKLLAILVTPENLLAPVAPVRHVINRAGDRILKPAVLRHFRAAAHNLYAR
jgi:hypothetical protein